MRRNKSYDKHVYKQVQKDCSDTHSHHGYYAQVEEGYRHYGGHSDSSSESECYTYKELTVRTETSYDSFTEETYSTHEAYYTETETEYSYEAPAKEYFDDYIEKPCLKKDKEEYYAKNLVPYPEMYGGKVKKCIKYED